MSSVYALTGWRISHNWQSSKLKVKVTLRLAVYRQSVRLGIKPLESHDHRFFSAVYFVLYRSFMYSLYLSVSV
jgi:hypothetical protein